MLCRNRWVKGRVVVCGAWLALASSCLGQQSNNRNQAGPEPNPGSKPSYPSNQINTSVPKINGNPPQPGQQADFGRPNPYGNPAPGVAPGGYPATANYPPATTNYPIGVTVPNGYGGAFNYFIPNQNPGPPQMPSEVMIYQDGEYKVAQDANDPKTIEQAREGSRVLAGAVKALRSESSSDEDRASAKKVLSQYLEAHFDNDQMKRREQVETLEDQIVKLKAQLEKRAQSKEQLIALRLKLLENDASGLAFPQSWSQLPGMDANGLPPNMSTGGFYAPAYQFYPNPVGSNPLGTTSQR